jgi:hypothetical protein
MISGLRGRFVSEYIAVARRGRSSGASATLRSLASTLYVVTHTSN